MAVVMIQVLTGDVACLATEPLVPGELPHAMDAQQQRALLARRMAIARLRADLGLPAMPLPAQGPPPLGCSASGSGGRFLVAVASSPIAIGVDLEIEQRWPLAAQALGITDLRQAAQCWVRIEAVVKAARCGLAEGLGPELIAGCAAPGPVPCAGGWWNVVDLAVPGGVAALATSSEVVACPVMGERNNIAPGNACVTITNSCTERSKHLRMSE